MPDPVAFGLIGCGGIANSLADGVEEADDAALVACADVVAERARDHAAAHGIADWYTDHEEMLADAAPDVAIVATPNGTHADLVVDCAAAGVHVLCQKPLAITAEGLDRMIAACDEHGVRLGGLYNLRYGVGSQATAHAVEAGALGEIVLANGTVPGYRDEAYYAGWHGSAELDGGCLFTQGIHVVDRLARFNDGIERVFADTDTLAHDIETEDVAAATVRYGNGARGTITVTTATRNYPHYDRIDLHGEAGYLVSTHDRVLAFESDRRAELDVENPYDRSGFGVAIDDMARAVEVGRDPLVPGREARHACDAILAIHDSAERAAPVRVGGYGADS